MADVGQTHDPAAIERTLEAFGRHNIGLLFQRLSRDFEHRARSTLRVRGHTRLQPSHQIVFVSLGATGARLTALAERAGMTKQAMGQIVDDLERLGYIERSPDPADGRAKLVRFTAKGLDFVRDAADVMAGIWEEYAKLLGETELRQLQSTLHELLTGTRHTAPGSP